jgi:Ca2+-binding RTX toxin-like protein
MADPLIIIVARAGTPEAATADYVCDGVGDEVEINAALAAAGAAGGGIVRLAAGIYSTLRPIEIRADNVSIEGNPAGGTIIRPDNDDWRSGDGPKAEETTGVVNFIGVDNFAARFLTVEVVTSPADPPGTPLAPSNGIIAIPAGPIGSADICTNGELEGNIVRLAQGHTYSIWSVRTEGLEIFDNLVDGGATLDNATPTQEGIEIQGGGNVSIHGNTVINMGNVAIGMGGIAENATNVSVHDIIVTDNHIVNCRVGVLVATTFDTANGMANATDILVEANIFEDLHEVGFMIRNWTGSADTPPVLSNVVFRDNDVEMLYAESSGHSPAAIWFFNVAGIGATAISGVAVEENRFTVTEVAAIPAGFWLAPGFHAFILLQEFNGITLSGNDVALENGGDLTRGILALGSADVTISENNIHGAGLYPIELYETDDFLIQGNTITDWGRDLDLAAIIVGRADSFSITGNILYGTGGDGANFIILYESGPATSLADNVRLSDTDATLALSLIQKLELLGDALAGTGGAGADTIIGNDLANLLDGGEGADTLIGGAGDDIYLVDNALDQAIELDGGGDDLVLSSVDFQLGAFVEQLTLTGAALAGTGNALANTITGNGLANLLDGGAGDDILIGGAGNDTLIGGAGDDQYLLDSALDLVTELAGEGDDLVTASASYVLSDHVERLTLTGAALTGTGNALANVVTGNGLDNLLDGGAGADRLVGGLGNDSYVVDSALDEVIELDGEGTDTVLARVSYSLAKPARVERLYAEDAAGTAALVLIGNAGANDIRGNAGNNLLHGGGGAGDVLTGLGGNDVYYSDVAGTQIVEAVGGGTDAVYASVSYALTGGSEVEILSVNNHAATDAINLTGNGYANTLIGNAGANVLHGGGGAGDLLIGLGGNDVYYTDVASTQVAEAEAGGADTLYTSVSYALASGVSVETLSANNYAATTAINLTGNGYANTLIGNAGANVLHGGGGSDVLIGFGGNDIYYTDVAATQVVEAEGGGADTVYASVSYALAAGASVETLSANNYGSTAAIDLAGSASANFLLGNAGANLLDGKGGNDTLLGFGGADTFAFSTALGPGNVDAILDFQAGTDKIGLAQAIFGGLALGALAADAFATGSAADASDRILYNAQTGGLFYDSDGNGAAAAVQFATVSANLNLTASDFVVL